VITNVPGPQLPLYNTGAKMLSNFGTGPVLDSVGLFHVISSYCGEFTISVTSCRELMPDPEFYRECLQASFDELHAATVGAAVASRKTPRRKAAGKKVPAKKTAARKRPKAAARPKTASRAKARPAPKRKAG
jgi:hypothetical protein